MMKIKTKKQLNLPQLIEWAWDNGVRDKIYYDEVNANSAEFDIYGEVLLEGEISKTDLYTVEVEEEITEDTVIPKMLVKFKNPDTYGRFKNDSINGFEIEEGNIEAFYIVNDDKTLTLIWRDGKLVK